MSRFVLVLPLIALAAAGCATASAKSKDMPALSVPPAPPRVIDPAPEPLPDPAVTELPSVAPVTPANTPAPRPNRGTTRPPATDPKTEQKPAEPPPPDPAPVPQPPAQPPAQLQTPQTADTNAAKAVTATIQRANGLLNGIDYRQLSNVRKKAYDDAKRSIQQAEGAMKEGNLVFAQAMATKAETLAKELAGK